MDTGHDGPRIHTYTVMTQGDRVSQLTLSPKKTWSSGQVEHDGMHILIYPITPCHQGHCWDEYLFRIHERCGSVIAKEM